MTAKKFSRKQIFNNRAKFFGVLREYVGLTIVGDIIYELTDALCLVMPPTVSRNGVFQTIRLLAGVEFTPKMAAKLAWRMAGNIDTLTSGDPVVPWSRQIRDEVVPICVEKVVPSRRKDKAGYLFHYRVLAGTPCAETFTQFMSANSCRAIARVIGFSTNSWGPYQYAGIGVHFVNLMFFAHIEAEKSRDRPAFHRVSVTSSMLKANKDILAVRCRAKPCPENFQHACANCPIGYNECGYAVHASTYVEHHCRTCNSVSFFDPNNVATMCINCCQSNRHIPN
jgi:hypothetical protein